MARGEAVTSRARKRTPARGVATAAAVPADGPGRSIEAIASDHGLLEPRHIQDLAEAVHRLIAAITRDGEARRRQHQEMLAALQQIATHTEGLPAIVERLRTQANGENAQTLAEDH